MEIIYYLINFGILAAILVIFGRKTVVSLFRTRRQEVEKLLDEANETEVSDFTPEAEPLPEIENDNAETEKFFIKKAEQIKKFGELECREHRANMLKKLRNEALSEFEKNVTERFADSSYAEKDRLNDSIKAEQIIKQIKLTPGDMSYLARCDVLYVTLVSSNGVDEDIKNRIEKAVTELVESAGGKVSFLVKVNPALIGGLSLRIGDTVYDGTMAEEIYHIQKSVKNVAITGDETPDSILSLITEKVKSASRNIYVYQRGRVIAVSDGICWMDGLSDIMYGEVVEFECGEKGMVLDIQKDRIGCVIFGEYEHIETGSRVRRVGRIAEVPVGEALLGRVVDAIGAPIDGKGYIKPKAKRPIENPAPAILDRAPVKSPLHTGIKAIDALVPIGKGQRELIIGDRQTGKTAIAVDTIVNQRDKDVICIYVAIGQKETTVADIREKLEQHGAMDYTVIVAATASGSAAMQYIAPFAATAIGEYFMYLGKDVLIVYDDLSKHAVAYRELSLLLQRPSGREAYPGDIFYLHSRLLERSAHLSDELGGGSLTALPFIETQAGDISAYIPTNAISITDGQIFLESELFHEGQRPAVNVGLSVSRVGGSAQTKLMKQVSSSLRTRLAQYRELAEFTQFGTDIDDETRATLNSGKHLTEALKQDRFATLDDWKQALYIYTVSGGITDSLPIEKLYDYEKYLYKEFESRYGELTDILKTGKKLDTETAEKLKTAVMKVTEEF